MFWAPARTCKAVGSARAPPAWHNRGVVPSILRQNILVSEPTTHQSRKTAARAAASAPDLPSLDAAEADGEWIASVIKFWLNEEWATMEVHDQLGKAAGVDSVYPGEAYVACRRNETEVQDYRDLVLDLVFELESFPGYKDTFVNNFEIGNKIVELLMLRGGVDVCSCSTDAGEMIKRHDELRHSGDSGTDGSLGSQIDGVLRSVR